jgi:ClpP class serine protease
LDILAILSRVAESIARFFDGAVATLSAMPAPQLIAGACVLAALAMLLVAFVKPKRDPAPSLLAHARPNKRKGKGTVPQAFAEQGEAAVRPQEFSYRAHEEEFLLPESRQIAPSKRTEPRLQPGTTLSVFGRDYEIPEFDDYDERKPPRVKPRKPPLRPWRSMEQSQHLAPAQSRAPATFQEWEPLEPQQRGYERQLPAHVASTREILDRLEAKRGSRVIAIIHRENMARDRLDAVDLEDALTAIRKTPKDRPLDVIIHSPGGWISCAQQIARAIKAHPAKTTVFVPYFALGSTSFMAFAADEVVMSQHAALSPVDPFVAYGSASSVLAGLKNKPVDRISDTTLIYADFAKKLLDETRRVTCELMHEGKEHCGACRMADELVSGKSYSWRAISPIAAKELGMRVSIAMPAEVYDLIRSCRRDNEQAASVAYLDYDRQPARAAQPAALPPPERQRFELAGAIDSSVVYMERSHAPKKRRAQRHENLVWLAHSGGHVPEAAVDRAKAIIHRIEQERGSRVICVIHGENMENEAFDFDDLEDVLSAIVASDASRPLDIVLHTQGGNSFTGRQIARAIKSHQARKTVFVPYFAMSAGSRIALAADQIVMGAHAMLGPIDTQLYAGPAPSIVQLSKLKPFESISDEYLILAEEARKIIQEGRATARELLQGSYSQDGSAAIADELISGKWTHGFPITAQAAYNMGLNVATGMPELFYDLVRCFRHSDGEEPSVLFLPR